MANNDEKQIDGEIKTKLNEIRMEGGKGARKRGRSVEIVSGDEKKETEKTPPTKRHTRSQSRRRISTESIKDQLRARDLTAEVTEIQKQVDSPTRTNMETDNIKSLKDMAVFFEKKFEHLPTKDYMDGRLAKIEEKTKLTQESLAVLERRVDRIESGRSLDQPIAGPSCGGGSGPRNAPNGHLALERENAFLKAIRSVRIWPIKGNNAQELTAAVEEFLQNALCMQARDLDQVIMEDIRRVRSAPRSKQHDEVCVIFREAETRDLILSYARNLASYVDKNGDPSAGIRMEVPPHLLMTHRLLTMYGFGLKNKYGKETRRIIKFDLAEQSLYLAYKLPTGDLWHEITPAMAKAYKDKENQRSLLHFSESLSPPGKLPSQASQWNSRSGNSGPSAAQSGHSSSHSGWQPSSKQTWTPHRNSPGAERSGR